MPGGIYSLTQVTEKQVDGTWPTSAFPVAALWAWGLGSSGRLGLGDIGSRNSPTQVGTSTKWLEVSGSGQDTLAIKDDGTLWAWGPNFDGAIGDGTTQPKSSPVQIGSLTTWKSIAQGPTRAFSAAIKVDGTLWVWGGAWNGQLGINDHIVHRSSPTQVGALTNWLTVVVNSNGASALKTDGTLWGWGRNAYGTTGEGAAAAANRSSPVQVGSITDWNSLAGGGDSCTATRTNGTLYTWGRNNAGQLGLGTTVNLFVPTQVGVLTNWANAGHRGQAHAVAMKTNGQLWAWGRNANGQLGLGDTLNRSSPQQIGALTTWSKVSGNGYSTFVLGSTTRTLWSWGFNNNGQLGQGNAIDRSSPVQVGLDSNWASMGPGGPSAFGIRATTS